MKAYKVFPVFISLIFIFFSKCNTTEPPPPDNRKLTLSFEDASCTEVWLRIKTENVSFPAEAIIKTDDSTAKNITLSNSDTVVYVDSLLPNKTYTIQAFIHSSNQTEVSSNEVTATTMDNTSHNFTFETFTFGEHSSSVLYDVAIIDENNIWAVGKIFMNDSLGNPDPNVYNAVHWDGNEWTLHRIMFFTICGQQSRTSYPAKSVFAFSENDIWIAMDGDQVARLNGTAQTETMCLPFSFSINKLWGENSGSMYAVGDGGNIVHYNGQNWQRIESGTDVDIQDIWGIRDNNNSNTLILCAASNAIEPGEHKILKIQGTGNVDTIPWLANKRVHSVWMESKYKLFSCGDGVFINNTGINWEEQNELTFVFTERIRGLAKNDLFVVGDFGLLAHYNGIGWKEYPEASAALVYTSLDYKNNLMVTVGYTQRQAVIEFMRKS